MTEETPAAPTVRAEAAPEATQSSDGQTPDATVGGDDIDGADDGADDSSDATADPGPPYLIADVYSGDHSGLIGGQPNWSALAAAPSVYGAIIKAWEGKEFDDHGWFAKHWPAVRDAGSDRYGTSWFRGAYLFLIFSRGGSDQADAYLKAVDAAGGWDSGDIYPIIDVELGHDATAATPTKPARSAHPNQSASKQQVIDCATACADRIREKTGRNVVLYGRRAMHHLGINDRMGCDMVWNPSYTPEMHMGGLEAWNSQNVVMWQYRGDTPSAAKGLPQSIPGFGQGDISVVIKDGDWRAANRQFLRDTLREPSD